MERRTLALVLFASGVWSLTGPGWGLVAGGAGLLALRVTAGPMLFHAELARKRARDLAGQHPRRFAAAALMTVAAVAVPVGVGLAVSPAAGLAMFGVMAATLGAVLGWE